MHVPKSRRGCQNETNGSAHHDKRNCALRSSPRYGALWHCNFISETAVLPYFAATYFIFEQSGCLRTDDPTL